MNGNQTMDRLLGKIPEANRTAWEQSCLSGEDLTLVRDTYVRSIKTEAELDKKYSKWHRVWIAINFLYLLIATIGLYALDFSTKSSTIKIILVLVGFILLFLAGMKAVEKIRRSRDEHAELQSSCIRKFQIFQDALKELYPEGDPDPDVRWQKIADIRRAAIEEARQVLDNKDEFSADRKNEEKVKMGALVDKGRLILVCERALTERRLPTMSQFGIDNCDLKSILADAEKIRAHVAGS